MINPGQVCMFVPPGLKKFKLDLFERISRKIQKAGGREVRHDWRKLIELPDDIIPIIGGLPELRPTVNDWMNRGRPFIYWDRGYARRVFATWLPRGENGGYYRWHLNSFQMRSVRNVPSDRWQLLKTELQPWQINSNGHIVVAMPTPTYERFHEIRGWTERVLRALPLITDRQIVVRDKETHRPLQSDTKGAYCLISHGSVAAVESVIGGCPVVVDQSSAAHLMGMTVPKLTDDFKVNAQYLGVINKLKYPDREQWARSLAYSQFNETELVNGVLWQLMA